MWCAYLLIFVVPVSAIAGAYLGGAWTFLTFGLVFGMLPLADMLVGVNDYNASTAEEKGRLENPMFDLVIRSWTPFFVGLLGWAIWYVNTADLAFSEQLGICLSVGLSGGFGIIVGHELMHRRGVGDRFLAEVMMSAVSYPHFCVEHVYGHHRKVATKEDGASSRLGESVYAFLPRTFWMSLRSFWEIETKIVNRKKLRFGSLRDRRVRYLANLVVAYSVIGLLGGWAAVAAMACVGLTASTVLEVINYLEHYGLEREKNGRGKYERVRPHHSWNSAHRISSYFMFNLNRHSDHHYLASRPYAILQHHEDAPQLPLGYGTMFVLALVPPVWHRIMDPRVKALRSSETVRVPRELLATKPSEVRPSAQPIAASAS